MTNQKLQKEGKAEVSPVVAAVTGAVVGASVAIAGAVALRNEKNRDKVKAVLANVKAQATSYLEDTQKQAQDKNDEVAEKLSDTLHHEKKATVKVLEGNI